MGGCERLRRVVYDASILMLLYDGIPVFEDAERVLETKPECIVPRQVVEELERIASSREVKRRRRALLALQVVRERECRIIDVEGVRTGDDAILLYVLRDCRSLPATADKELRRRLREKGIPHLFYKAERGGLVLEG